MPREQSLSGGNASGLVVRVDASVRKVATPATVHVHALLRHLRERGVDVPRPLGHDEHGRQMLEFVPGTMAEGCGRLSAPELHRVGGLVRSIHDACVGFRPSDGAVWETAIVAPGDDLVCHNDLAPWNLVTGERWVFIDWDASAPSTRLWDLAYATQAFTLSDPTLPTAEAAADLRAFVDGYGADPLLRQALPDTIADRTSAMLALLRGSADTGQEPWATMFHTGHGAHWAAVDAYVRAHRDIWERALL